MRRCLSLAVLAVVLVLVLPSSIPSKPQSDPRTPRGIHIEFNQPSHAIPRDIELRFSRMNMLRTEIRNRRFIERISRSRPDINLRAVARQFNIRPNPELSDLTIPQMEEELVDIEEEFHMIGMTYGVDDTQEIFEGEPRDTVETVPYVSDESILDVAHSVVAIVDRTAMKETADGYTLTVTPFVDVYGGFGELCTSARTYNSPTTKVAGTGFLIAPDVIATAGHVLYQINADFSDFLSSVYFVFDFVMKTDGEAKTLFTKDEVYEGKEVLAHRLDMQADWALVRLENAVTGRQPLEYRHAGKMSDDAKVYMIGHPNGMTQKYSGAAEILENTPCVYFMSNLDTGPYNSGSPVFNVEDNVVEGVLVRDVSNFEEICDCYMPGEYTPQLGLPGVDVIRTTEFAGFLTSPDSVLVRCRLDGGALGIVITALQDTVELLPDESRFVAYHSLGMELVVSSTCALRYYPERGSIWEIVDVPGTDYSKMEKACHP